jgi:hypothetical protein
MFQQQGLEVWNLLATLELTQLVQLQLVLGQRCCC